jgi:hypothetical protein
VGLCVAELCRTQLGRSKSAWRRVGIDKELAAAAVVHNFSDLSVGGLETES